MKLTKSRLKQLIREVLSEQPLSDEEMQQKLLSTMDANFAAQYDPRKTKCPEVAVGAFKAHKVVFRPTKMMGRSGYEASSTKFKGFENITFFAPLQTSEQPHCLAMTQAFEGFKEKLLAAMRAKKSGGQGQEQGKGKTTRTVTKGSVSARIISTRKEGNEVVVTVIGTAGKVKGKKAEGRARARGSIGIARQVAASKARTNLLRGKFVN